MFEKLLTPKQVQYSCYNMYLNFFAQDRTLEKIEEVFSMPWFKRGNVLYYVRCACFMECAPKRKDYEVVDTAPINQPNVLPADTSPESGEKESLLKKTT